MDRVVLADASPVSLGRDGASFVDVDAVREVERVVSDLRIPMGQIGQTMKDALELNTALVREVLRLAEELAALRSEIEAKAPPSPGEASPAPPSGAAPFSWHPSPGDEV